MKVIAFNGSPRKNGNTYGSLKIVLRQLEQEGMDTEMIQLGGKKLSGCIACGRCSKNQDQRCAITDDDMNIFIAKMIEADGILIGSPVYFGNVSTEVKALIDRSGYVSVANGGLFKRKAGAAVVAARRAGTNFTYAAINFFFGINQMIVPNSNYWNMTLSRDIGDLEKDEEGKRTFEVLGQNMAWLLKKTGV
ncbi:flavodoxin family protein [Desulforamulus ruminis]|uniref:NADPH-dependent FMN reductase n=1 Tax=Desulforamulus ruminis (strain ATCC 23193 / DSM 2154 / NCIMB 8452 / DL) TaxID=696281 RepID=F6DR42_DESRL|nr:flavodoxin family protein [Desulforamulus ruminis]AEG59761.1 NADPH-dependent FMN reductase [Desulforamulus ruminis DSM 2154]